MLLSPEDFDLLESKWSVDSSGYLQARRKGKICRLHKLIQERLGFSGCCDHANGNKLDNRRENLRPATKQQNAANSRICSNNSTGYKGVILDKRKGTYMARVKFNGRNIHIGSYATAIEAHAAYINKAKELFGEYANAGTN